MKLGHNVTPSLGYLTSVPIDWATRETEQKTADVFPHKIGLGEGQLDLLV